jgi:hypothetical protein
MKAILGQLEFTSNVPHILCPQIPFRSFVISCRYGMELSANISPSEFRAYKGPFVKERTLRVRVAGVADPVQNNH